MTVDPSAQLPAWLGNVYPDRHERLLLLHEALMAVDPGYRVADLKEKYGEPRLYLDYWRDDVEDFVFNEHTEKLVEDALREAW